ncbi:uncharacterized protein LOC106059894 [Biomphalaria glabrata]|uniref:Uncharacterized protein LOC106059894 n=1 Tax=Biomphalaria glabrata TaxID=6526 RepID=A0A2C9LKW0_BIOGL|nr:uncharacterized protein LOC106059894 [Biomphalaria glabrata]XP_055879768.1 uncharacterized protein LOC106059894 [Biomphalaria glabrata]XP_055879769.1 uncharacterized protein LOC106059894 [Biomphalaria glabrata]XP_055879770.1 uncharacterized protein LOC106059894 [Biomphalaria glabrata]XP_055879771.1 uncharacterized protein LOC106059894 [Biomphalaria glabrata]
MGLLDGLNINAVVLARLLSYAVLVFFSFFIFVGVAVMKDKYNGLCVLYIFGPVSNCNYAMAIAIIFQLFYALYRIVILFLFKIGKFTTDMFLFSDLMELVHLGIDLVALFLTFIAACILSAGHNANCGKYNCTDDIWVSPSRAAQAGAWISTIVWLLLFILEFLYMMRHGKIPFLPGARAQQSTTTNQTGETPQVDTMPADQHSEIKY